MTPITAVASILVALLLGAMSPGPGFVLVARNAIGLSRRDGIATAVGMGIGGIVFSGVAPAGLYTLLTAIGWLYIALKVVGGMYLLYLASRIWRGASESLSIGASDETHKANIRKSFWLGLSTQLSNPKTAIVYGSIFVALLPQHPPVWCYFALPPLVFTVEAGWYTVVAACFSGRRPREIYLRMKKWIDGLAAGAIGALGLRLMLTANKVGL